MAKQDNTCLDEAIEQIGVDIRISLDQLSHEQRHPGYSADDSDGKIKELSNRVRSLRRIREELELISTGALL